MFAAVGLVLALLPSAVSAADPAPAEPSDFDGDGYVDLAVGSYTDQDGRGAVNVLYGSSSGLTAAGDQLWSLDSPGIPGTADPNDLFGGSVASGDFDGDGYADLAVGAPSDDATTELVDGSVTIIYGTATGLAADGAQRWKDADIGPGPGLSGRFGWGLTTGDYDGDGYPDLAVGVTWVDPPTGTGYGAVDVLFGGPDGLSAVDAVQVTQATPGLPGRVDENVRFGTILASGDFDGDGIDDLAIGRPDDSLTGLPDDEGSLGSVNILYGTVDGPSVAGAQLWSQDTPGIVGKSGWSDYFGESLATGDFDHDGFADVAIGTTGDKIGGRSQGSVTVIYGSASGLTATDSGLWYQSAAGVPGANESWDNFGKAVAAGDFDSDGWDDLAVGAPGEDVGNIEDAGAVTVLYGSTTGIRAARSVSFTQDSPGVPGAAERGDLFAQSLAAGDYGRSGRDDLAIGAWREAVGLATDVGVVDVLYGRLSGINGTDAQGWSRDSKGIKGFLGGHFGWDLTP